jgi:hypothetical protein
VTRKIALFTRGDRLLTIHRAELPALAAVEREWTGRCGTGEKSTVPALAAIAIASLGTYDMPLEQAGGDAADLRTGAVRAQVKSPAPGDPPAQAPNLIRRRFG